MVSSRGRSSPERLPTGPDGLVVLPPTWSSQAQDASHRPFGIIWRSGGAIGPKQVCALSHRASAQMESDHVPEAVAEFGGRGRQHPDGARLVGVAPAGRRVAGTVR